MRRALPLLICAALVAGGCARLQESRLNPLNWFGRSTPVAAAAPDVLRPLVPAAAGDYDLRQPIGSVTEIALERTETGAILRATGTAPGQGWHNAQLVEVAREAGTVTYEFRVMPPATALAGAAQEVTVARLMTNAALAGIHTVRVMGAAGGRETRR